MTDHETLLNVAAIRVGTRVNGPGLRAAIWVQGCTLRCPGCFNPVTHPHEPKDFWVPERLAERLAQPGIEGISVLGGEPFQQAAACARLAMRARELGASVVTYSGYTWKYLRECGLMEGRRLLDATDLLIAGPYVAAQATDGNGWRGSANQEFVYLTGRYGPVDIDATANLPVMEMKSDGRLLDWTGIPAATDLEADCNLRALGSNWLRTIY